MLTAGFLLLFVLLCLFAWVKYQDVKQVREYLDALQEERLKRQDERRSEARQVVGYLNKRG